MKTFFIISGIVLLALIIIVLYVIYDDIRYRIEMHRLYKKALQELDEQEKEIMDKLKKE